MLKVLAFARYGELLRFSEIELPMPDPPTMGALLKHPALAELPPEALLAINQMFVGRDELLRPGDEIALMPPVSGG